METLSPEQTLGVGLAHGLIIWFDTSNMAKAGDNVNASTQIKNDGELSGEFFLVYHREELDYSQTWLKNSARVTLAPGQVYTFNEGVIDKMPNRDPVRYIVRVYHQEVEPVEDGWAMDAVELVVQIQATLTITLSPGRVRPGGTYKQSGRLTRNDTGAGIGGATIALERYDISIADWASVGSAVTDANGYYSKDLTAPSAIGDVAVRSHYYSTILFIGALAYGSIGVGALAAVNLAPPMMLGVAAGGVTFIATRSGRKSVALGALGFLAGLGYSYLTQPQTVARRT